MIHCFSNFRMPTGGFFSLPMSDFWPDAAHHRGKNGSRILAESTGDKLLKQEENKGFFRRDCGGRNVPEEGAGARWISLLFQGEQGARKVLLCLHRWRLAAGFLRECRAVDSMVRTISPFCWPSERCKAAVVQRGRDGNRFYVASPWSSY